MAELAFWSFAVLVPTLSTYVGIRHAGSEEESTIQKGRVEVRFPKDRRLAFCLDMVCRQRFPLISSLNLPGVLVGAPVSVLAVAALRRNPSELSVETWHTITIPFFALPGWWFVGRSLDALFTRRRPHWAMLVVATILTGACIALAVGIFASGPTDRKDLLLFLPGAIFWTFAFGILPANWFISWRRRPQFGSITPSS